MRLPTNEYVLDPFDVHTLKEIDLLSHYHLAQIPDRNDVYRLRVLELVVDKAVFSFGDPIVTDLTHVSIRKTGDRLYLACSCTYQEDALCPHAWTAVTAILNVRVYRPFFDRQARQELFAAHGAAYGLQDEPELDNLFTLQYDEGNLLVQPIDDNVLFVASSADGSQFPILPAVGPRPPQGRSENRILVIGRHRFYRQLRFELIDVEWTKAGKIKSITEFIDPAAHVWKTEDADAVKFYAAIQTFQNSYDEENSVADLEALKAIQRNPLNIPFYYHHRELSEKINGRSLTPIGMQLLEADLVLSVFKRKPFYEIDASLEWMGRSYPVRQLRFRHRYFLADDDQLFLIADQQLLQLLEHFRNGPERFLVHETQFEDFKTGRLDPLAEKIKIHYAYIRPATAVEAALLTDDRERILYISQEGSYIVLTPVMRYGGVEVALYSKKEILVEDANGNLVRIARDLDAEDIFKERVVSQHADFKKQLEEPHFFYLHHREFLDGEWFLDAFDFWRNEGITLLGFEQLNITKMSPHKAKIDIKVVSGTDWFNAKLKVSFGQQQASMKQLYRAIRNKTRYVQLDDGATGILPEAWLEKIAAYFRLSVLEGDLLRIPKAAYAELGDVFEPGMLSDEVREAIAGYEKKLRLAKTGASASVVPKDLNTELRPYQREGLHWLLQLDELGFGGCLADDMGLGKTVQIIAFLLAQREKRGQTANLVVTSTSLIFNWYRELQQFAPTLRVLIVSGSRRNGLWQQASGYDVILTTYGVVHADIQHLKKIFFNSIILDESQTIKNPSSERYKAVSFLRARVRFALTGTPVENNTFDLYGQLSIVCPGLLGSKQYFSNTYAIPIDRFGDGKRSLSLQQKIAPFILRRTKAQVAKDLPDKNEMLIYCEMGEQQRAIYTSYEQELRDFIAGIDDDELGRRRMHVLAGLTKLRQICNAPALLKEGYDRRLSAKIDVLLEQLEIIATNHKVVVFSQFVEMLNLIKERLDGQQIGYAYLTGATKDRGSVVQQFQDDPHSRIFLISLKAGGTGLNLTAAAYVFLVDPWWNPAVENQAIDRIYRIGQNKQVFAVRLLTPDTIEEKIRSLQEKKQQLATDVVKVDLDVVNKFNKHEWLQLLS